MHDGGLVITGTWLMDMRKPRGGRCGQSSARLAQPHIRPAPLLLYKLVAVQHILTSSDVPQYALACKRKGYIKRVQTLLYTVLRLRLPLNRSQAPPGQSAPPPCAASSPTLRASAPAARSALEIGPAAAPT